MNKSNFIKNVFIVGSKSIGQYGGYETFVDKLTEYHQNNKNIKYHVTCKLNGIGSMDESKLDNISDIRKDDNGNIIEFTYHNARVVKIKIPNIGSAEAIYYDVVALNTFVNYCKDNNIEKPIFYILASRIGPFIGYFKRRIKSIGGYYCLNPDGHEWKRSKWSLPIQKYWKLSERFMVKHSDLVICDSLKIEDYILEEYKKYNPNTTYISYGSEIKKSRLRNDNEAFVEWLNKHKTSINNYYLMVGRLVPENNYETIVREFMKTKTKKDLVLITDNNNKYIDYFEKALSFSKDSRVKFVEAVYDQQLLKKIRENAYANIHGHEVGGTNPSLLEALGSTKLNLLNDVGFNKEVADDAALYWNKDSGVLSSLINKADRFSDKEINRYGKKAKDRIENYYSWQLISERYIEEFDKLTDNLN